MAALLCAKDLCKTYVIDKRQNNVLKNVNLEVKEGPGLLLDIHISIIKVR